MIRKVLLICGALSVLLYALSDLLAGLRWHGYSFRDQTISELNAFGSPVRPLTITFGLALYLLMVAFGVGIWRSAAGDRRLRVVGILLAVLGLLSLPSVPFASMHVRGAEQGVTDTLHLVGGMVVIPLLVTAMGFAAAALGRRFLLYTIATVVVLVAFGVWAGVDSPKMVANEPTPWMGVIERISVYSYQLWLIVLAIVLLRAPVEQPEERRSAQTVTPTALPLTPSVRGGTH